jgi:RNA polymerase sigma-70 factor (ECF subfamily)
VRDAHSFDEFYRATAVRTLRYAVAAVGDRGEAQDAVQEAFIRAWNKRNTLDVERSPETWVRIVASRLAISRWRRARKALRPPDRAYAAAAPPEPSVNHVALTRALQQLPAEQRRAIVLHHLCDMSVAEIAVEIGAPTGTIKARLARGRAALAGLLSDHIPEEQHHA